MKYVSDSIGDEYKEWDDGKIVYISSPTGSGKTTFILEKLLPVVAESNKKILYLVNRTILKKQIEQKIGQIKDFNQRLAIDVKTYQQIEERYVRLSYKQYDLPYQINYIEDIKRLLSNPEYCKSQLCYYVYDRVFYNKIMKRIDDKEAYIDELMYHIICHPRVVEILTPDYKVPSVEEYAYVVCDECHYFLMDSNYNTNTIFSYHYAVHGFLGKKRIFMSATIDEIKNVIEDEYKNSISNQTGYNVALTKEYKIDIDYSYINTHYIKRREEICRLIMGSEGKCEGKWLVFVDNKEYGRKLKRDIINSVKRKQNSYVDFDEEDELESDEYDHLVSFITSDYKEDLDGANEVVRIVRKNKANAKILIVTSVLDNGVDIKDAELRNIIVIVDTKTEFIQMLGRRRKDENPLQLFIYAQNRNHFEKRLRSVQRKRKIIEDYMRYIKNLPGGVLAIWQDFRPSQIAIDQSKILLQRVMKKEISFEDIEACFTEIDGCLMLNYLSFYNLNNLNSFYSDMIEKFDTIGDNAFIREQLEWLGKSPNEIESELAKMDKDFIDLACENIHAEIQAILDKPLERGSEALEIKEKIRGDMLELVKMVKIDDEDMKSRKKRAIDDLRKLDRPISKQTMEFIGGFYPLPYKVENKDSICTFRRSNT